MKIQHIITTLLLATPLFALQSCLDFDTTGDEFKTGTSNTEKITHRANVDTIHYKDVDYDEETYNGFIEQLEEPLSQCISAQYCLRGGKNGAYPGEHAYQYQYCLGSDGYAQYGVIPHKDFPYSGLYLPSTYSLDPNCYASGVGGYNGLAQNIVPFLNHPLADSIPEMKAAMLLLYDFAAIEAADLTGPLTFTDVKTNKQNNPYTYESVKTIYEKVFQNIDDIIACWTYFDEQHANEEGEMVYNKSDEYRQCVLGTMNIYLHFVYKGDGFENLEKLIRFANSLKLRMAMHIVKVEPEMAREKAEEAIRGGVIETEEQEMSLRSEYLGFPHPLYAIYKWGDMRMSASMESLLNSLQHPFLGHLFLPNEGKINDLNIGDKIVGIRSGTYVGTSQNIAANKYIGFSKITPNFEKAPLYLMKLSEVCFLRAEGAIRGWEMGGSAEDFYYEGIRKSNFEDRFNKPNTHKEYLLDEYSNTYNYVDVEGNLFDTHIENYMNLETAKDYTYVDPIGETPDMHSLTKIGVKWNDADPLEVKLEKIITQKYIAGFPNSFEAWGDLRRTGYPRLFHVLNVEESDGSIFPGQMIRRMPFPGRNDAATMQDIINTGIPALNGIDECGTRLWWDIDKSNF